MRKNILKKVLLVVMLIMASYNLAACGNKPDDNGSMKSEDGRKYGGLIEAKMGETAHTVFFDLTVDSAKKCSTYQFQDGLYVADEGKSYLEITVTVTNTYDKDLPMSISDFTLDFSDNASKDVITGYGNSELGKEEFMDNIYTLKQGESITKTILFIADDRAEYLLCYKEFYEDKFEGDSYEITVVPEVLEPAVTTEAVPEEDSNNTEVATEEIQETQEVQDGDQQSGEEAVENEDTGIEEE